VAIGRLNKQIAVELDIVEKTVKVHRGRAMQKLGVRSVADLVRIADKLDVLSGPHSA
jgi:FixJ family two-component response regulator